MAMVRNLVCLLTTSLGLPSEADELGQQLLVLEEELLHWFGFSADEQLLVLGMVETGKPASTGSLTHLRPQLPQYRVW